MAKRIVDEEMRFSIVVNGNEAQKEIYELEKATKNLRVKNQELRQERVRLSRETGIYNGIFSFMALLLRGCFSSSIKTRSPL